MSLQLASKSIPVVSMNTINILKTVANEMSPTMSGNIWRNGDAADRAAPLSGERGVIGRKLPAHIDDVNTFDGP